MNILIICTYFPPDSAIAAVRPYMLAKNLSKMGNHVTVIRSGKFHKKPDDSYGEIDKDIKIISYLGQDSDAEMYKRGEYICPEKKEYKKRKIPKKIYKYLSICKSILTDFKKTKVYIDRTNNQVMHIKKCIDDLNDQFDIVFSTYSELENIYAGEYAAKKYNAKWVQDFRDPIVSYTESYRIFWNHFAKKVQKDVLDKADAITCVSKGLSDTLSDIIPQSANKCSVIYNGYEKEEKIDVGKQTDHKHLTLCYTGGIYDLRVEALEHLVKILSGLIRDKKIDPEAIRFIYAGEHSNIVFPIFKKYEISELLLDYGYVTRMKAEELQNTADLFVVLSWNTRKHLGVLTGKFYEGIRAKKPIVSIVAGNKEGSELKELNESFHYGVCYECMGNEMQRKVFEKYLIDLCMEKQRRGYIEYNNISETLEKEFEYSTIAESLYALFYSLTRHS